MDKKWSFIFWRYFLYSLIALEIFLLPKIIEKTTYAYLDYLRSIINTVPLLLLGLHSGFLKSLYNYNKDLSKELVQGGFFLLTIIGLITGIIIGNLWILVLVISYGTSLFFEKIYQGKGAYFKAISYKPLLSIVSILVLLIFNDNISKLNILRLLSISYALAFLFYGGKNLKFIFKKISYHQICEGIRFLIRNGFWLNLGTLAVSLFYLSDRYFLKQIDTLSLANYAFAFNFAQGIFLMFSGIAFINENQFGKNLDTINKKIFNIELRKAFFLYLFFAIIASIFFYITTCYILPNYKESFQYFIIIMASWGIFYASSVVYSLLQYLNLQRTTSILLIVCWIINISVYLTLSVFYNIYSARYLVIQTSVFIVCFTFFQLLLIYKNIRK